MSPSASPDAGPEADATRPRSGILTPTSDSDRSVNRRHGASVVSSDSFKRRPADSSAMEHLLRPPITLKPHPPNLHVQPRTLQPLMLLPRECLPLSCLDLANPHGELPPSRHFESRIKILDLESRMGSAPKALIARSDSRATLYVVERHDSGLYVACKLGSWTVLGSLASQATVVCEERIRPPSAKPAEPPAQAATTTPQTHKDQKKKRVAIEAIQSLVRKRPRSQSTPTLDDAARAEAGPASQPDPDTSLPSDPKPVSRPTPASDPPVAETPGPPPVRGPANEGDGGQQQTADSIFDNIRSLYFEALYKSKGSLAYFAKGPLSRARSAFHLDLESDLDINDLIDFLKGLVLTTVQIDKKHRETIPDVISKIKPVVDSSDEGRKKRRKSKKMKLGKDGLYPQEDERIQQWWALNKPEIKGDDELGISMDQIKAHVSLLRTRETQLQMIVIMEILALEPLRPQEQPADTGLPALPGVMESQEGMAPPPPPKKRNKHNLPVLLDVHADRLTIWQSMASDEQILLQDSQIPTPTIDGQLQRKASAEPLRDFCVDVIVPFYSSRLPQLCDSLSRKLGGPVIVSPPKPKSKSKLQKRPSGRQDHQRPGAAARRTAMRKVPQTLEHALSFEQKNRRSVSRGPSQIEDLMRATSASVPSIKREDSEPSGIKAPPRGGESSTRRESRPSLSRSSSLAGLGDSKANKKARIDEELRDAISNLRKPNRDVVGRAMAEADEQRATTVVSAKKRRSTKPSMNPSGIQVKATPANQRFKDVMGPKPVETLASLPSTEELIPPSSIAPATAPRNGRTNVFQADSSPAYGVVGHTPVKRSTGASFLRRPAAEEAVIPPSSPVTARTAASPTVPASVVRPSVLENRLGVFPETPIKQPALMPSVGGGEKDAAKRGENRGASIYEKLGWDDDLDDL